MSVIDEIKLERDRQITDEGYDKDHDDAHLNNQMAMAAACYCADVQLFVAQDFITNDLDDKPQCCDPWPFDGSTAEAKDGKCRRRQLIIAAALIVAEIERIDRLF